MERNPKLLTANRPNVSDIQTALLSAPRFMASLGLTREDVVGMTQSDLRSPTAPLYPVGKGHYAYAFSLPHGGILKVTDDADDAAAADLIRRANANGEHPVGLLHVMDVKRFKDDVVDNETLYTGGEPHPIFAIVTEAVVSLKPFIMKRLAEIPTAERTHLKELLGTMAMENAWTLEEAAKFSAYRPSLGPDLRAFAGGVVAEDPALAETLNEIMQGVKWLSERGFQVRDLHAGNFGRATGDRMVLFDFGHGSRGETESDRPPLALATNSRVSVESIDAAFKRMRLENTRFAAALKRIDSKLGAGDWYEKFVRADTAEDFRRVFVEYKTKMAKISPENAARREEIMREWEDSIEERLSLLDGERLNQNPLPIDNENGIGSTSNNGNVDYLGLRVRMKPSVFHKLTLELPRSQARSADALKKKVQEGAKFGAPTLYLDIPDGWEDGDLSEPAQVSGHEGRNRMYASKELYGDDDLVETHIFPNFYRNRHVTSGWVERINRGLISERHGPGYGDGSRRETPGPFFTMGAISPNGRAAMPQVRAAFDECFEKLMQKFPDFGALELHHDEKAGGDNGHGSERQFGYCMDTKPIRVAFAAKTEKLPVSNIRGLMAHEFGHALDYRYGKDLGQKLGQRLPDGVERRADAIAQAVFGRTIKYDSKDVQCVDCKGVNVRPRRLGA